MDIRYEIRFDQSRSGKNAWHRHYLIIRDFDPELETPEELILLYKEEPAETKKTLGRMKVLYPPVHVAELAPEELNQEQEIAFGKLMEMISLTVSIDGKKYLVEKIDTKYIISPKIIIRTKHLPEAYLLIQTRDILKSGIAAHLQEDMKRIGIPVVLDWRGSHYDMDVFWDWFRKNIEPEIDKLELKRIELSPNLSKAIKKGFWKDFSPGFCLNLDTIWKILSSKKE